MAFVVRLGVALALDGLRHPELNEYDGLARNLLLGKGFAYPHIGVLYYSYAPPLYSWMSAASYWLTGSIAPLMALQLVTGAALAVVSASLAGRLFGGWIAPAATGLLVAFHPGLIVYNATKAHPLTFDAFFFSLALWQTFRLMDRQTVGRAIAFGAIIGVGTLSRATIVIFLPLAAILLLVTRRASWRVAAREGIVAGLCAAAIVAPWTIRNSRLHHQFVFLLTTDSEDFWRGNNAHATGHSYVDAEHIVLDTLPPAERAELRGQPNEIEQARWFSAHARAFIQENPAAFVRLTLLKFFHFWWFAPQTGVLYPRAWFLVYAVYYIGALLFAALGLWSVWRIGSSAIALASLIAIFMLALSTLQSLYYVEGRHRWAIEPMLLVLSGGGVAMALEGRDRSRRAGEAAGRVVDGR